MQAYYVLIDWDTESDLLFASTDEVKANAEAEAIRQRWEDLGEPKDVWVEEHEFEEGVLFDYDWFNPIGEQDYDN